MGNIIRSLIAFLVFMILFVGGSAIGGGIGGTLGFIGGLIALYAIASGKVEEWYYNREIDNHRDQPGTF